MRREGKNLVPQCRKVREAPCSAGETAINRRFAFIKDNEPGKTRSSFCLVLLFPALTKVRHGLLAFDGMHSTGEVFGQQQRISAKPFSKIGMLECHR